MDLQYCTKSFKDSEKESVNYWFKCPSIEWHRQFNWLLFYRKALIIEKEDGRQIVLEEGKEAVLSPGDIVKFNLHKFHYKVEDKLEKDENDTDSDEESEAIQLNKKGELFNKTNGSSFRWQ